MFQEPSSHPLSRWQTSDEGNGVLESLFLACFSAACWNLEAGWVLHRQGSVALQKPCNLSLKFSSMPSLSPNKFALNLLAASAFQGHALYNLLPTKLQKANKRAMEGGLKQHYNGQPEPQLLLHTKQALFWQADAEYEGRWEVSVLFIPVICRRCSETGQECSSLQLDSARPESSPPAMNCPGPRYCWQRCLQLQATLYVHIQASGNDFYTNLVWKHPNFHQKNPLGTAKAPLNNGCKKKKKSFTQDSLRILLTLFKSKAVTLSDL